MTLIIILLIIYLLSVVAVATFYLLAYRHKHGVWKGATLEGGDYFVMLYPGLNTISAFILWNDGWKKR